jgi:hypothetical protein
VLGGFAKAQVLAPHLLRSSQDRRTKTAHARSSWELIINAGCADGAAPHSTRHRQQAPRLRQDGARRTPAAAAAAAAENAVPTRQRNRCSCLRWGPSSTS